METAAHVAMVTGAGGDLALNITEPPLPHQMGYKANGAIGESWKGDPGLPLQAASGQSHYWSPLATSHLIVLEGSGDC